MTSETADPSSPLQETSSHVTHSIHERPRICLIDVDHNIVTTLKAEGFNCYEGTLGPLIEVNNTDRHSFRECLLHYNFPLNLHEYDIVIIDL